MKSIFETESYSELQERLSKLTHETERQWGTMNAAQMAHHCQKAFEIPLGLTTIKKPNFVMRMMFKTFKSSLYNDKLWKPNLPTVKEFVVKEQKDFNSEVTRLNELMGQFHAKRSENELPPHPSFGKMTMEQWGKMQYKHMDHHLRQFGV